MGKPRCPKAPNKGLQSVTQLPQESPWVGDSLQAPRRLSRALGAGHAGQRAGKPGMCSSPGIPPGPRCSGPFSLLSLFTARGHRMTLGGRLVPCYALSPLGDTPQPPPPRSPLPRAPSQATCLLPHVRPATLPASPSLPPGSAAPLSSPHQRLAPTRTRRMRRCQRSPSRRGAYAPRGAPHTLLPQLRTEPRCPGLHRELRTQPRARTPAAPHGTAAAAPTDLGAGPGRARAANPEGLRGARGSGGRVTRRLRGGGGAAASWPSPPAAESGVTARSCRGWPRRGGDGRGCRGDVPKRACWTWG